MCSLRAAGEDAAMLKVMISPLKETFQNHASIVQQLGSVHTGTVCFFINVAKE